MFRLLLHWQVERVFFSFLSTRRFWAPLLVPVLCVLAGCSSGPPKAPEIGEAYTGPATLKLRKEIALRSPVVATVTHGERLGIIGRRRIFVKVRTPSGAEGWTSLRQLLSADQMEQLNRLAEAARLLPSQGAATVYESLNVHTEPNRRAPSFYRIKEGELADVVAHELSPRVPFEPTGILPRPTPKPTRPPKPRRESRTPPPPPPPAPKPPDNWLELSQTPPSPEEENPEPEEPEPAKPTPADDWALVRLRNGRAGWVLMGNLKMNIPDAVAQYSEGHHITSYFPTADVSDEGQIKHNWLWTTIASGRQPYEFDSFRYFIWNVRHHRYETAYVERNLKGFYPVEVGPVQATVGNKTATYPGFTLIVEENGVRYRKTYAYQIYLVRLISKERIETPAAGETPLALALARAGQRAAAKPEPQAPGFFARLKGNFARLKARWFGRK
jgi:hypothetical protein